MSMFSIDLDYIVIHIISWLKMLNTKNHKNHQQVLQNVHTISKAKSKTFQIKIKLLN